MPPPPLIVAHLGVPFPVGLVRWIDAGVGRTTFVAKLTYGFDGSLAPEQAPLAALDEGERTHPRDFVPRKPGVDLLISGSARSLRPTERMEASVVVEGARRRGVEGPAGYRRDLWILATSPAVQAPLGPDNVLEADGRTRAAPLGRVHITVPLPDRRVGPWRHEHDFDFGVYQVASPAQQLEPLPEGARLGLRGAFARGEDRTIALPVAPALFLDRGFGEGRRVELRCDTIDVDLDGERLISVHRGEIAWDDAELLDVDRIVARPAARPEEGLAEIRRGVPRAHFVLAEELGREPEEVDEERLRAAAFEAMEIAGEPRLSVREYAAISAALAEGRPPRSEVLVRHGHTEESWAVEERAQGEAMAQGAWNGDVSLAAEFGEAFVAAQDALAQPEEEAWTIAQHARLLVALERTDDVNATLAEHGLTNGAYLRVDRRILARVERDRAAREELEAAMDAARAELPPEEEAPDDDDEDDDDDEEGP